MHVKLVLVAEHDFVAFLQYFASKRSSIYLEVTLLAMKKIGRVNFFAEALTLAHEALTCLDSL